MNALKGEFWAQLIFAWVRMGLVAFATLLEGYGVVTHSQAEGISNVAVAAFLSGLLIQLSVAVWQYAKTNGAVQVLDQAIRTNLPGLPQTPAPPVQVPGDLPPVQVAVKEVPPVKVDAVVADIKKDVAANSTFTVAY